MQARITYTGLNHEITQETGKCTILEASIKNQIPHLHECGGHGKCTTCRVRVLEGMKNLSPKTPLEKKMAEKRNWDPSIRLACQSQVKGNVKLQRLIWSSAEVSRLQTEAIPEGKAEERQIAILFCDLRNFTRMSSANLPFDIAYMLNQFYTILGDPILMNNGIIYQYVGDEIVGVFGTAGGSHEKNCMDAIRAAIGMQYALERLNKLELKDFDFDLKIGIGINFGLAYVGHLGHPTHRQFSVIGDPVNVASRIQGETKKTGAHILISNSIYQHACKDNLNIGASYCSMLNGKEDRIEIHELLGFKQMDLQLELQASLHLLLKEEGLFSSIFYEKVFQKVPAVRNMFKGNMQYQGKLLTHMLAGIVHALARPEHLVLGLKKLGKSHQGYGVTKDHFPIVKTCLLESIPEVLGKMYSDKIGQAWSQALDFVTEKMLEGMTQKRSLKAGNMHPQTPYARKAAG